MEREGGGHSCLLLPFFHCSFQMGAAHAAPVSFHFFSNRGSTCCPRFFSFLFERGSTCCPHVFSFCFKWGWHTPSPILFILNRGSTCCPHVFSFCFKWGGQHESHTLPPFLSVSIEGNVYPTAAPIPFGFKQGQCVSHTPPPVSFGFDWGQREPHTPPPFCVLYSPIMGGILFFYFN